MTKNEYLELGAKLLNDLGFDAGVGWYGPDEQWQLEVTGRKDGSRALCCMLVAPEDPAEQDEGNEAFFMGNFPGTEYRPEKVYRRLNLQTIHAFVVWVVKHNLQGSLAASG